MTEYEVIVKHGRQHWEIYVPALDATTGAAHGSDVNDIARQARVMVMELTGTEDFRLKIKYNWVEER